MIEREGSEGKLYIKTVENDYIEITSKTAWKVVDMYQRSRNGTQAHKLSSKLYDAKTNAALHIDELVQIAKNQTKRNGHATDYGNRHDADGFTYRDVFFRDYDGEYYLLTISIMESNVKNEAYSIGKIDRRTTPQRKSGSSDRTAGARGDSSSIEANNNTNTQTSQGFSENSSKNRGSISDKMLAEQKAEEKEAKRQAELADYYKSQLKLATDYRMDPAGVLAVAKKFVKEYGIKGESKSVQVKFLHLSDAIKDYSRDQTEEKYERMMGIAKDLAEYGIVFLGHKNASRKGSVHCASITCTCVFLQLRTSSFSSRWACRTALSS